MALYGYARVSTAEQDCTLQEQALRAVGCTIIRAEKVSGSRRAGRDGTDAALGISAAGGYAGGHAGGPPGA